MARNSGNIGLGSFQVRYLGFGGFLLTDEGVEQLVTRDGVLRNLFAQADSNSVDGPTEITITVDGVDSVLTLTIPASSTAMVSNSIDVVVVAPGQRVAFKVSVGGTVGGIVGIAVVCELE